MVGASQAAIAADDGRAPRPRVGTPALGRRQTRWSCERSICTVETARVRFAGWRSLGETRRRGTGPLDGSALAARGVPSRTAQPGVGSRCRPQFIGSCRRNAARVRRLLDGPASAAPKSAAVAERWVATGRPGTLVWRGRASSCPCQSLPRPHPSSLPTRPWAGMHASGRCQPAGLLVLGEALQQMARIRVRVHEPIPQAFHSPNQILDLLASHDVHGAVLLGTGPYLHRPHPSLSRRTAEVPIHLRGNGPGSGTRC